MSRRRLAYAIAWELPDSRRCLQCKKFLSEGQVAGHDLSVRPPLRWCEGCLHSRERRIEARMWQQSAWAALGSARTIVVSGAA